MLQSVSVRDYMSKHLVTFTPDVDVMTAIDVLVKKGISGAPVVDKLGNLVGMLSEKDCLKVALNAGYHGGWGGQVGEFMTPDAVTVDVSASILDVARKFIDTPYKRFPVMDDNRLVGQISRSDILRAIDAVS